MTRSAETMLVSTSDAERTTQLSEPVTLSGRKLESESASVWSDAGQGRERT